MRADPRAAMVFHIGTRNAPKNIVSRKCGDRTQRLAKSGVEIGQKRGHLLVAEPAGKGRHHSLPFHNDRAHRVVGKRRTAGQNRLREKTMQVGRHLLQLEVVVLVAVGAASSVEMLPFLLLRGECRLRMAAGDQVKYKNTEEQKQSGGTRHRDHSSVRSVGYADRMDTAESNDERSGPGVSAGWTRLEHAAQNRCFGCGVENPRGLHLEFERNAEGTVRCHTVVPDLYEGPPGYVHGGILATLLDEAMSKSVRLQGVRAVTRHLEADYRLPVPSQTAIVIEGRCVRNEGRKYWAEAVILDAGNRVLVRGKGLFIALER